jgi:upstream-binding transcription factor
MVKDKEEKKDKKKNACPEKKRPTPAYMLWVKDQWHEVEKENPEAEFKDISNMLGAKWKTVSAEEKKPYEEKYHAEKEAYLQVITKEKREIEAMKLLEEEQKQKTAMELLEQYMQFKQETEKENKKNKKEKDPLKPKHPMSAYFLFTNDRRAALLADNKGIMEVIDNIIELYSLTYVARTLQIRRPLFEHYVYIIHGQTRMSTNVPDSMDVVCLVLTHSHQK